MPNWLSRRVLIIALLLSTITAIAAYWYLFANVPVVAVNDEPLRDAVVILQDIPADTIITREMVVVRQVPARYVQPTAVQTVDQVVGKITTVSLLRDEQITEARLAGEGASPNRLAYSVPEGYRAITIPVNEITGVGGYPTVGDRVDLLVTVGDPPISKMLMQNIEILATGNVTDTRDDGEQRIVSSCTLCVTPADAQQITLAGSTAPIRLILRSPVDEETLSLPPTTQI